MHAQITCDCGNRNDQAMEIIGTAIHWQVPGAHAEDDRMQEAHPRELCTQPPLTRAAQHSTALLTCAAHHCFISHEAL